MLTLIMLWSYENCHLPNSRLLSFSALIYFSFGEYFVPVSNINLDTDHETLNYSVSASKLFAFDVMVKLSMTRAKS